MSEDWAAENLQTIRTLMERAAVYRRALAPVMTVTGVIGLGAAFAGWKMDLSDPAVFLSCWLGVALVTLGAGMVLIRRQALQQSERFWSPPTRRVAQALVPTLFAGLVLGVWGVVSTRGEAEPGALAHVHLPLLWVILYGGGIHAAGFFMQRGIRLFGWVLILLGCAGFFLISPQTPTGLVDAGYAIMGGVFGLLHLLYGLYLFATEKKSGRDT